MPDQPRWSFAVAVLGIAGAVLAGSFFLATRPGAEEAQEDIVRWLNDPPFPVAGLLAISNPLFRPWPLAIVAALLLGWLFVTTGPANTRGEAVRAAAMAFAVAEVVARLLKRLAEEPRPLAVYPDLESHGYPREPSGDAFPSAHTAVVVGLVAALWPWMRTSQRVVAATVAVLVPLNRVYVGAHWPLDLVGGAAAGMIAAAVSWLVAGRWPLDASPPPNQPASGPLPVRG